MCVLVVAFSYTHQFVNTFLDSLKMTGIQIAWFRAKIYGNDPLIIYIADSLVIWPVRSDNI